MGTLFETLEKKQGKSSFARSEEMSFFLDNRILLSEVGTYAHLLKAEKPFEIIRANIIIRAIINKLTIERLFLNRIKQQKVGVLPSYALKDFMNEACSRLPFLASEQGNIYVPIFAKSLNLIYSGDYEKLLVEPYSGLLKRFESMTIDPFDYYGSALFDSYFTRLAFLKEEQGVKAFYDYDADAIYLVNEQGRLDVSICLFDRYMKRPSHTHMLERILPVVDAYFAGDLIALETSLVENKLISSKLILWIESQKEERRKKAYGE